MRPDYSKFDGIGIFKLSDTRRFLEELELQKESQKLDVQLVLNSTGEPDLIPDDFFMEYAELVTDWVSATDSSGLCCVAHDLARRARAYVEAFDLVTEAGCDIKDLRHDPYVLTNYDSLRNGGVFTFIFKCENNGSTYRVKYKPA